MLAAHGDGLSYKISDMSMGYKPFDCFRIANYPAYVVPVWYVPRKKKTAYYLPITKFVELMNTAPRKSMTEDNAIVLAEFVLEL